MNTGDPDNRAIFSFVLTQVTQTTERINLEKLKQRERITFYDDIMLFEDELSDNGCSVLNVKIVSGFELLSVLIG